ncbi:MAG: response regulator transcription factor [Chloroflexota bacterium]|jgi:DNA-binding response OmpR family regulator
MRILVIEDDEKLARLIVNYLQRQHHTVDHTSDGISGTDMILHNIYDVAVIDWMLPHRSGPDICAIARAANIHIGLLLLTARGDIDDRISGLRRGADDYLTKPFDMGELVARIDAIHRRVSGTSSHLLISHNVQMDPRAHTVTVANHEVLLTMTEFALLELFIRHAGQALTRDQILHTVWNDDDDVLNTAVDVYVSYLRRKLHPHAHHYIETVRGIGYRWQA